MVNNLAGYMRSAHILVGLRREMGDMRQPENVMRFFTERRPQDVTRIFQELRAAADPLVRQGSDEVQRLHQEIDNRLRNAVHLQGSALRDTHVDIFFIFLRILQLLNRQQEQEKIARQYERELQTKYMLKVADNFDTQGTWQLNTAIGSGILSVLSGICPILQHSDVGGTVMNALPDFMKQGGIPQDDLFKAMGKMFYAGSEISKNSGQVQSTYSEGWRTVDHHKSEFAKMLGEDLTRNGEEERSNFNNLESALTRYLQMEHDLDKQLAG